MKIVEFLLNNLLPIFFAVLCLIAALKSIEIVKRSEVELMTKRRKEIERFESDTRKKYDEQCENQESEENQELKIYFFTDNYLDNQRS